MTIRPARRPPPAPEQKPEREPGLWQRVGEYWWLGMNASSPEAAWTGKHDAQGEVFPASVDGDYAWSAAFVSYVMRIAGAARGFPYAAEPRHLYQHRQADGAGTRPPAGSSPPSDRRAMRRSLAI